MWQWTDSSIITVNFQENPHDSHPITHPLGQGMVGPLWVQTLTCVILESLHILNRVIMAPDWMTCYLWNTKLSTADWSQLRFYRKWITKIKSKIKISQWWYTSPWNCSCGWKQMSIISQSCLVMTQGSFYWHGLTFIPAWINNHMPSKVWDEITYPFPNFNRSLGMDK